MIHNCQEPGCTNSGSECFYPESNTPDRYYCISHASKHGFCYGCGEFYGGIEQFEFPQYWGNIEGYCPNCSEEIEEEWREADDDEEEYEEWEAWMP